MLTRAFTDSRSDLWEEEHYFGSYIRDGLSILDLGCANGRVLKLLEKHKVAYTGVDANKAFVESAAEYARSFPMIASTFVNSDLRSLPVETQGFDLVMCIATLHHLPSSAYQLQALREMYRVLKPGGLLLMTNWDLASQPGYVKKRDALRKSHPELFDGLEKNDFLISWRWRLGGNTMYRYYHSFTPEELTALLTSVGFRVRSHEISTGAMNLRGQRVKKNIVTTAEKPVTT